MATKRTRSCTANQRNKKQKTATVRAVVVKSTKRKRIPKNDDSRSKESRPKSTRKRSRSFVRYSPTNEADVPAPIVPQYDESSLSTEYAEKGDFPQMDFQKDESVIRNDASHQGGSIIGDGGGSGGSDKQGIPLTVDLIDASNILALVKLGQSVDPTNLISATATVAADDLCATNRMQVQEPVNNEIQSDSLLHLAETATMAGSIPQPIVSLKMGEPIVSTIAGDQIQILDQENIGVSAPRVWLRSLGVCACGCGAVFHPSLMADLDQSKDEIQHDQSIAQHPNPANQSAAGDVTPFVTTNPMPPNRKRPRFHRIVPLPPAVRMAQDPYYNGPYALPPPYTPQCLFCNSGYYPILNHPHYYAGSILPPPPPPAVLKQPIVELSKRKMKTKKSDALSTDELRRQRFVMYDDSGPPNGLPPVPPPSAPNTKAKFPMKPSKSRFKRWSKEEDAKLLKACEDVPEDREHNWSKIAKEVFGGVRSAVQCKSRWHNMIRPGRKVGAWTPEEDEIVIKMKKEGKSWEQIAERLPERRTNHIRERWITTLDPSNKYGPWTDEEMNTLLDAQEKLGNKWLEISKLLPGRSVAAVKNRFYNIQTSKHRAGRRVAVEAMMKWDWQKRNQLPPSNEGDAAIDTVEPESTMTTLPAASTASARADQTEASLSKISTSKD